jgi:hypothetical protein
MAIALVPPANSELSASATIKRLKVKAPESPVYEAFR